MYTILIKIMCQPSQKWLIRGSQFGAPDPWPGTGKDKKIKNLNPISRNISIFRTTELINKKNLNFKLFLQRSPFSEISDRILEYKIGNMYHAISFKILKDDELLVDNES